MAGYKHFRLKGSGVVSIMRSKEMMALLEHKARKVAHAAGPGHVAEVYRGRNRARATVTTTTWRARRQEWRNHSLVRALDAARD